MKTLSPKHAMAVAAVKKETRGRSRVYTLLVSVAHPLPQKQTVFDARRLSSLPSSFPSPQKAQLAALDLFSADKQNVNRRHLPMVSRACDATACWCVVGKDKEARCDPLDSEAVGTRVVGIGFSLLPAEVGIVDGLAPRASLELGNVVVFLADWQTWHQKPSTICFGPAARFVPPESG